MIPTISPRKEAREDDQHHLEIQGLGGREMTAATLAGRTAARAVFPAGIQPRIVYAIGAAVVTMPHQKLSKHPTDSTVGIQTFDASPAHLLAMVVILSSPRKTNGSDTFKSSTSSSVSGAAISAQRRLTPMMSGPSTTMTSTAKTSLHSIYAACTPHHLAAVVGAGNSIPSPRRTS